MLHNIPKTNFILLLLLMLGALTGCSAKDDTKDPFEHTSDAALYKTAQHAMRRSVPDEAIQRYEALEAHFPYGEYTKKGQLEIIYAYYLNEDYASALKAAERYVKMNPDSEHLPYVYYMQGIVHLQQSKTVLDSIIYRNPAKRDMTNYQLAFNAFNLITEEFPHSNYAKDARQHMVYIRNIMAEHELRIAEYYFKKKEYTAVLHRASDIIEHYQGTPSVYQALVFKRDAARQLQLTDVVKDTEELLQHNQIQLANYMVI